MRSTHICIALQLRSARQATQLRHADMTSVTTLETGLADPKTLKRYKHYAGDTAARHPLRLVSAFFKTRQRTLL